MRKRKIKEKERFDTGFGRFLGAASAMIKKANLARGCKAVSAQVQRKARQRINPKKTESFEGFRF